MVVFSEDPALTKHEWDITAAQERIKILEETLFSIAMNDWSWTGGGSNRRKLGVHAIAARRCLGLPLEAVPGWPRYNGEEEKLRCVLLHRTNQSK